MAIVRHLIVDQTGVHIGKHSGRLRVVRLGSGTLSERTIEQAPLIHLESVLVSGRGISFSADAVEACCEHGIPIHFVNGIGRPYAAVYSSALTGTVQTRRSQIAAFHDQRGLELARAFAWAKIRNQAALLKYLSRNRRESDPALAQELALCSGEVRDHTDELEDIEATCVDQARERILSAEGRAAHHYWSALKHTIPDAYGWPGRERRGASDPVNAALNYGYGILYAQIERSAILAGLDPYAGFTHVDRPGKPSLVLDMVEEFRVPAIDRIIIGLVNKQTHLDQDDEGLLTKETRRLVAEHVLARLEKPERYEGKRHTLRAIMQLQARHIASFVRQQRPTYTPFTVAW